MPAPTQQKAVTRLRGGFEETTPIEVIRVLGAPAARRSFSSGETAVDAPARRRAGEIASWLREGGDRAERPRLDRPAEPLARADALDGTARREPPVAEATEAERLALRIRLFGGEIVEQVYGPSRRWALLDRDGDALETPPADWVQPLIEAGLLTLARFERGAAVWRLAAGAVERRAAVAK